MIIFQLVQKSGAAEGKANKEIEEALGKLRAELSTAKVRGKILIVPGVSPGSLPSFISVKPEKEKNLPFFYFSEKLKAEYGKDYKKVPLIKEQVDSFLSWLRKNPGLLGEFETAVRNGEIDISSVGWMGVSMMINLFASWSGAKHAESRMAEKTGIQPLIKPVLILKKYVRSETTSDVEYTPLRGLGDENKTDCARDGNKIELFLRDGKSLIDYVNIAKHEWIHTAFSVEEGGTALLADEVNLPKKATFDDSYYPVGRRDFYNTFANVESNVEEWVKKLEKREDVKGDMYDKSVDNSLSSLANEYLMHAVYPWLRRWIKTKEVLGQVSDETGEEVDFKDIWRSATIYVEVPCDEAHGGFRFEERAGLSAEELAAKICGYFKIKESVVAQKLGGVFAALREYQKLVDVEEKPELPNYWNRQAQKEAWEHRQTYVDRKEWKVVKKFVELMNGAFGVPDSPITPGYVQKTAPEKGEKRA